MPRTSRLILPGRPHHVTQRGNRKLPIFHDDADRQVFLDYLELFGRESAVEVQAFCLMPNHVHFVAIPHQAKSFEACFKKLFLTYCKHFNKKYDLCGHLFQGRYFSCPLEDKHLKAAIHYVELNPVRARLVVNAENYRWCSAYSKPAQTREEDLQFWEKIRRCSVSGRLCGAE